MQLVVLRDVALAAKNRVEDMLTFESSNWLMLHRKLQTHRESNFSSENVSYIANLAKMQPT